jgi:hypothetical protein
MKLMLLLLLTASFSACQTRSKTPVKQSAEDVYIDRQLKIIESHKAELVKMGRMSADYGSAEILLGRYGWHTSSELSSVGATAPLWLLKRGGDGGSFGAYSFYQPAFEQAKRTWVIDAFMLPGSDLLWVRNRNIKFDKSVIGLTVEFISEDSCWKDDGATPCEEGWNWKQREIHDAKIIDVFGHTHEWESWGTGGEHTKGPEYWEGPLRLDKKAPAFMQQYGIIIKPPDWVDMCACMTRSTGTTSTDSTKPCVQGGTLAPGETCSLGISVPIQ